LSTVTPPVAAALLEATTGALGLAAGTTGAASSDLAASRAGVGSDEG